MNALTKMLNVSGNLDLDCTKELNKGFGDIKFPCIFWSMIEKSGVYAMKGANKARPIIKDRALPEHYNFQ